MLRMSKLRQEDDFWGGSHDALGSCAAPGPDRRDPEVPAGAPPFLLPTASRQEVGTGKEEAPGAQL